MAPRTRRSKKMGRAPLDHTQRIPNENLDQISLATYQSTTAQSQSDGENLTKSIQPNFGERKRKCVNSRTITKPPPLTDAIKRARGIDGHPTAPELMEEGDTEVDEALVHVVEVDLKQRTSIGKAKGKQRAAIPTDQGKQLCDVDQQCDPTTTFQLGDDDQSLPELDIDTDNFIVDGHVENIDDWVSDKHLTELSHKNPSKLTEAIAIERPVWKGAGTALGRGVAGPSSAQGVGSSMPSTLSIGLALTQTGSTEPLGVPSQYIPTTPAELPLVSGQDTPTTHTPAVPLVSSQDTPTTTPVTGNVTNLVFIPGSRRIKLSMQNPLVQLVIMSSFDILRSLVLFNNAFPDGAHSVQFVKEALVRAALKHKPGTMPIYQRLMDDHDYFSVILPVPRVRISTLRFDVKERCCKIVIPAMEAIGEPTAIANYVTIQLQEYRYTCPSAQNPRNPGLVKRTLAYRNDWIIMALHKSFFSGGSTSFAMRFDRLFTSQDGISSVRRQVPLPMVSLVATALYVALFEWHMGKRQQVEFTASAFVDVYTGNADSLRFIMDRSMAAYNHVMEDIYTRARTVGTAIAPINVDELE